MSAKVPNPIVRAQVAVTFRVGPALHPDYVYWAQHWEKIRDAEIGEIEIKRKREVYLKKQKGHDNEQYNAYLDRAVFFNMTSKTLSALYGTVFKRNPKITGFSPALKELAKNITKDKMSLHLLSKTAVKETLAMGRYGLLVDATDTGEGDPFIACYTAENILDWNVTEIRGRFELARVVLRELFYDRSPDGGVAFSYKARYRVLTLTLDEETNTYVYEQLIFVDREATGMPSIDAAPDFTVIPTVRGEPLDYIPFQIIGPFTNTMDIEKPPILDIVLLNLSHYKSYAQLEQGRYYTGNPIYWAKTSGEGPSDYYVGPDIVWELGTDDDAGIIEFQGNGLKFLESALEGKEQQIAAIGGRMMPGTSRAAAESDNSLKLKEQNEQTLLLNIADTIDEALTTTLRWWADWSNASPDVVNNISFELNRDFLLSKIGAREFRAIHQMYADGVIPVTVFYSYMHKAEVIPEWMDEAEFTSLLEDTKQFPHMVDVLAQMKNFPDADAFHEFTRVQKTMMEAAPKPGEPGGVAMPQQARAARGAA